MAPKKTKGPTVEDIEVVKQQWIERLRTDLVRHPDAMEVWPLCLKGGQYAPSERAPFFKIQGQVSKEALGGDLSKLVSGNIGVCVVFIDLDQARKED